MELPFEATINWRPGPDPRSLKTTLRSCRQPRTCWRSPLMTRVRPLTTPKKMQIGQDGVPIGFGPGGWIRYGFDRGFGAVNHVKAAVFCNPANADIFAEVVRLRVDGYLAFWGIEALIVDRLADGIDGVAAG